MSEFQIRLYSGSLSERLAVLEEELTAVGDKMDLLDDGAQALSGSWEGAAFLQWKEELHVRTAKVRECTEKMNRLIQALAGMAQTLAETEKQAVFLMEIVLGKG